MRFRLQDVKKQVQRRTGKLYVTLHFLRPGELHAEIDQLVTYHEHLLNQPQRLFSADDAHACVGDYRLAHCLIATLSAWYSWQGPDWQDVWQQCNSIASLQNGSSTLEASAITSPGQLRLALYNFVNEHYSGFLDTKTRLQALQAFAAFYTLEIRTLEYLLELDSEDEKLLVRHAPAAPRAEDVAALYNQWVFEAALFNASDVHFLIDCNAFKDIQDVTETVRKTPSIAQAGIGAVVKRLCYLARKIGVYYDLAYDPSAPDSAPRLHLTLYGPQEMTGAPQQYGLRLARLCRLLLEYRSYSEGQQSSSQQKKLHPSGRTRSRLSQAILEAEATVHFLQRSYHFFINTSMLNLLQSSNLKAIDGAAGVETPPIDYRLSDSSTTANGATLFDSSIEQTFAEEFSALKSSDAVDGWRLEREPEPLLLEQNSGIFIPDFALTRAHQRIYVEILGFWTPSYRERKIAKLQQLQERKDLLLAIPVEAREAFASISQAFPIIWYEDQLSATALLNTLRTYYDNFAERLFLIDIEAVRKRVLSERLLPEHACYEPLHCYRRSELSRAAERIVSEDIAFSPSIGLYQISWLEQLRHSFVEWIKESTDAGSTDTLPELSLTKVLLISKTRWPELSNCNDTTLEALISGWPEVRIYRSSIFDAVVQLVGAVQEQAISLKENKSGNLASPEAEIPFESSPKKQIRERRTPQKKKTENETRQGDLWGY